MAADAKNRETMRDAFATLLSTALVGAGNPVQAVYGYLVSDFDGQSPVVVVSSAGSEREPLLPNVTDYQSRFNLSVMVFVADASGIWTDQNVEDRLDLIEKEIADVIADNRVTADWRFVNHRGASQISAAAVGGESYALEIIPIYIESF